MNGQICPAVLLSTRDNKLMKAYHALQDFIFDGQWATHVTWLLTTLAKDFSPADNQVLVLPQDSFFPSSWEMQDLKELYGVHEDAGEPAVNNHPIDNLTDFIENFQLIPPNTWQRDWRLSSEYVLAQNSNFARLVYPAVKHALDNGFLDGAKGHVIDQGSTAAGAAEGAGRSSG
ncbi:hypothetical protein HO173_006478 [Letharia columbiana]|uniref:Uncharacterized protein n=1 Tax=Letharia columbiana TaxID=112416 RepID=A0A8H6FUY8_9LECA|nr:uncharacterized protein HO173_006478 [Letharia columbiana]KAF6235284.1 hypothetical protein HO173_006478 [Letharia columbiana]